jgi:hypothetical protein
MAKLYCLRGKDGTLYHSTMAGTKTEVWGNECYFIVADEEGDAWRNKYWKRWDASMASAKRLGWNIVPVVIREVAAKRKRKKMVPIVYGCVVL